MNEDKNKVKQESEKKDQVSEDNIGMINMLLSKNKDQLLDSETMILETSKKSLGGSQKRL